MKTLPPEIAWHPLIEHMLKEYGLILTVSDAEAITAAADKSRMRAHGIKFIVVNAINFLDQEELKELAKKIQDRIE